jgi:hypothetical protein
MKHVPRAFMQERLLPKRAAKAIGISLCFETFVCFAYSLTRDRFLIRDSNDTRFVYELLNNGNVPHSS